MERFSGFTREAESEILILSPFIKVQALKSLVESSSQRIVGVITRWRTSDILSGASDLEIFELLSEHHIPVMVNSRLHMKGIVRDQREILLSTANITRAGLGACPRPNIECATVVPMQEKDRRWLAQVQRQSILITRQQFERFCAHVESQQRECNAPVKEFSFAGDASDQGFSVFDLPWVDTPQRLLDTLKAPDTSRSSADWTQIAHDADTFGLPLCIGSLSGGLPLLRHNFFAKPIIAALIRFIANKRYFGEIKLWLRRGCADANLLTNAELIQRVRSVFNWVVELSDGRFTACRPNFSQCLIRTRRIASNSACSFDAA